MKQRSSHPTGRRAALAALAGIGLALGALPTSAQTAVVTTGEDDAVGATIQSNVDRAMRQAQVAIARAADVGKSVALRFTAGGAPRTLVLPGAELKTEEADRLGEDLGVMSRILEKSIGKGPNRAEHGWSGVFLGGGPSPGPDAMYLDGFGALFLLRVDFPLVAPAKGKSAKEPAAADRTWEETRRELREGGTGEVRIWDTFAVKTLPEFDDGRVKELRDALVGAFKHASNLAGVKADENVAVTVFGPLAVNDDQPLMTSNRRGRVEVIDGNGKAGSMLTLRAKKADIDAWATGKLSDEEFGKKVRETLR